MSHDDRNLVLDLCDASRLSTRVLKGWGGSLSRLLLTFCRLQDQAEAVGLASPQGEALAAASRQLQALWLCGNNQRDALLIEQGQLVGLIEQINRDDTSEPVAIH